MAFSTAFFTQHKLLDNLMSIKVSPEINLKNIAGEYHYVF
jgi:hypothetical protein